MPNISISVKNKIAVQTNRTLYVCGNSDYTALFDLDAEWNAFEIKTARFCYNGHYSDVVFTGNECEIPIIADTNEFEIGLFAGNLHTTTPAMVLCERSILSTSGTPTDPSPDVYHQLIEKINSGMLRGPQGDPGKDAPQIDDGTISRDSPWSSRRIIETLCPPIAETGNPVTCYPVAGYPLGVVASWAPTQAGEGEPYPAGGGKNLFNPAIMPASLTQNGVTWTMSADGVLTANGEASGVAYYNSSTNFELDAGTYAISAMQNLRMSILDAADGTNYAGQSMGNVCVFTMTEKKTVKLYFAASGTLNNVKVKPQIEKGSVATAYAPYENIRPISGRTKISVKRCGENLLDMSVVAESKNVIVDGDIIHVVDTSGWGQSYIIFDAKFPAGTYTIAFDTIIAKKGRVIVRPFNTDGKKADAKVTVAGNVYYVDANKYYNGYMLVGNNPPSLQKIQFTVAKAAYFQVGFAGGLASGETKVDIINPTLAPGSAPTTYVPYRGDARNLQLPRTVYGGNVDAVTGDGTEEWKFLTLTGEEQSHIYTTLFYLDLKAPTGYDLTTGACSHYKYTTYGNGSIGVTRGGNYASVVYSPYGAYEISEAGLAAWKAYLADQYAAGTPVQIAYKLAEPVAFQATGNGPLLPIPGETNTIMTDADSVTVTGRADPAHAIAALQAQLAVATQQLEETQAAMVDTTAAIVDYVFEQDCDAIGGGEDADAE